MGSRRRSTAPAAISIAQSSPLPDISAAAASRRPDSAAGFFPLSARMTVAIGMSPLATSTTNSESWSAAPFDDAGEDILNAMVGAAKGGDMRAAELVLQRIWPIRKGRPIALTLPTIKSASDVVAAVGVPLHRRLDRLEAADNAGAVLLIWRDLTQTAEQAKARWHAEHPEKGDPDKLGVRVLILGWTDQDIIPATIGADNGRP